VVSAERSASRRVLVVVPAWNEQDSVGAVVGEKAKTTLYPALSDFFARAFASRRS
jgi:hypothetical protein